ncbi:MAG: hypothetical protein QXW10_02150, partial [Candidatus Micrarchaeaceae archaeon]
MDAELEPGHAVLSKSSSAYKLELNAGGKKYAITWEQRGGGTLKIMFNRDGAITMQEYSRLSSEEIEKEINRILEGNSITDISNGTYKEVRLDRACPKCGTRRLRLASSSPSSTVPVMPIYICESCGAKSYYLTDEDLEYLVSRHGDLFTEEERKELDASSEAFLKELKEYIIRIFA